LIDRVPVAPSFIHAPRCTTYMHTQQDVMVAVSQTLNLNGIRIWGGHVLVSSGTVTFNGCIFYDLEIVGGCGR